MVYVAVTDIRKSETDLTDTFIPQIQLMQNLHSHTMMAGHFFLLD
jgi:hypothetical protein